MCPERRQDPAGVLMSSFFGSHSSAVGFLAPVSSVSTWLSIELTVTPAKGKNG
jgi:hypothetical protein